MKLEKIYVSSFGKIKDFEYNFNEELNEVNEQNGWGKTTLAVFIKCMFYGIKDGKTINCERIKYRPWNTTEKFGGYIIFSVKGKAFKLERFFGSKKSEDTIKMYDNETGKEYSNTENLGERIFGIDEDGYFSTTFYSQNGEEAKSNTTISAKFNNLGDDNDSKAFLTALDKLNEKYRKYSYSGNRGVIPEIKREITEVNEKIKQAETAQKTVISLKEERDLLDSESKVLKNKIDDLRDKLAKAGQNEQLKFNKNRYEKAIEEKKNLEQEKLKYNQVLRGENPSKDELKTCEDCIIDLEKTVELARKSKENIDILSNQNQKSTINKKQPNLVLLIISAIMLVGGIVSLFFLTVASIVLFSLAVVLGIISFVLPKGEITNNSGNLQLLEKEKNEYNSYTEIASTYNDKLKSFFGKFNLENVNGNKEKLAVLKETAENYFYTEKRLFETNSVIKELEQDKEKFLKVEDGESLEEINQKLKTEQEWFDAKIKALSTKNNSITFYEAQAESLTDLEDKKLDLKNKLSESEKDYELLGLTLEYLKKADENLKLKYRNPVCESLNKYLKYIDKESGLETVVDVDLNVFGQERGINRESEYYSEGYKNLFDICKRFALVDAIYKDDKPIMILDDPFYNLDDLKVENAKNLIKKLSKDYQILYLVCHKSRSVDA